MHWRRKWQPTPVFLPGEPRDGAAWWAAVCGVAQRRTRLKRLSSSSSSRVIMNLKAEQLIQSRCPSLWPFIVPTHLPTPSSYFRCSYIKFPKSGLGFIQKLCSSPFCLKIYKSSLSLKVQLKWHFLQKAPSHLPTGDMMPVLSILHFLKIIYLYLFCEITILTSPPEFVTSAYSQN